MTTTRSDRFTPVVTTAARRAAAATAVLVALAAGSLVLFFTVAAPFGAVNDALNAATGVACAALAVALAGGHALDRVVAGVGVLGGAVFVLGSYLALTDTTGWFLAGLVSGVGGGLTGAWLLLVVRRSAEVSGGAGLPARLGRRAGGVMALGLCGLPAALAGVDDGAGAPWYAVAAMLGWLGTYLLFPLWCVRVSRAT